MQPKIVKIRDIIYVRVGLYTPTNPKLTSTSFKIQFESNLCITQLELTRNQTNFDPQSS